MVLTPNFEAIPSELRDRSQWVIWRLENGNRKMPYQTDGKPAKSNDPTTWDTFENAKDCSWQYSGIGFVFSENDPYIGIDLDGCRDPNTGTVAEWAQEIIMRFDSYCEASPSETGFKIFCRGKWTAKKHNVGVDAEAVCPKAPGIEAYDRLRYFTVTGAKLEGVPGEARERQEAIDWLVGKYFTPEKPSGGTPPNNGSTITPNGGRDARHKAYGKKVLEAAVQRVLASPDGGKHFALRDASFCCGHFIPLFFSLHDAENALREAIATRGAADMKLAWHTIETGLRKGMESPEPPLGDTSGPEPEIDWSKFGGTTNNGSEIPTTNSRGCNPGILQEHLTDAGNARRLVMLHGEKLRYCHPWKKWLVWDGARWREDDTGTPERMAKATAREIQLAACKRTLGVIENESDPEKRALEISFSDTMKAWGTKSESAGKLAAMVALAQSEVGIPILPAALNSHPWLLNCPNGTIDLKTGQLRPHDRADNITQLCPTPFDPAALCPTFCRFMEDVFQSVELIAFVRRLMGYSLTGSVAEQVLPILHGTGANGKSTLLNAWLAVLGTDYGGKAPASMMVAHRGEHHPTELAALFGKRLVVATETESGARLAESQVKELTGGDKITARRMREDFWTFDPTHKLILATNHKPKVKGRDHAIWRRLRLIPFTRRFAADQQDRKLPEKLAAESPGILAWMVRGCLEWQEHGLGEPAEVKAATDEYRGAEDVLAAWMDDCCERGNGLNERGKDLFASYKTWCEQSGERATLTARGLNEAMREAGLEDYRNDGPAFRGIGLRRIPH